MARNPNELQIILEKLFGTEDNPEGTDSAVYFQPPESIMMSYPCLVYARDLGKTEFANNQPYLNATRYQVTVIARDPNSEILEKVTNLSQCLFMRHYVVDNLNHDVFYLYF
jgi:hypothetical protein